MLEIQNAVTEMKNVLDGLISKLNMAKERVSKHEDRSIKTPKLKCKERKKWRKKEQNIQELWDNFIRCNIRIIIGIPVEEKRENAQKKCLK